MSTNGTSQSDMSKDEVGWLFVQQYYTTLSKTPSRLHLFYSKKSQFVSGNEAEVAEVSVGRPDIQERIAKLDFEDCKVRVSNVDTQSSLEQIVIQVIGELSNKSEDSRKFVQTFVLAQQPSGYFVLNDIFRYIKDEDDEPAEEEAAAAAETKAAPEEAAAAEAVPEAAKPELDAAIVDEKLEEAAKEAPAAVAAAPAVPAVPAVPAIPAVATPAEPAAPKAAEPTAPAPSAAVPAPAPEPEKVVAEVAEEAVKQVEEPKEPAPTPAAAPAAAAPVAPARAEPEKPKGPPKPMTWASRIAAATGPVKPVVPKTAVPATAAAAAAPAAAAAAKAPTPATAPAAAAAPKAEAAAPAAKEAGSEWQTAGNDSKRQSRPQQSAAPVQDKDSALGYIKYVTENVDEASLRAHLEKFGQVVYFDINRTKNCAFIEFASAAGYQAAAAANPHTVNGENIMVEPRRPKAGAYGGANYSTPRGGAHAAGRGRGGFEGRNGSQSGGRGGFGQNRGRGGAGGAPRGRGGAQNVAA